MIPLSTRGRRRWQIVCQDPRLGFVAKEGKLFVTIDVLSTIFLLFALLPSLLFLRPYPGKFLFFVLLRPCRNLPAAFLYYRAIYYIFVLRLISGLLLSYVFVLCVVVRIFLVGVFCCALVCPVPWHLICVFFTSSRSFYPSTPSTPSVRADSSSHQDTSSVVTNARHSNLQS